MKPDLDAPWLVWRKSKDGSRTAYWISRIPDFPLKTQRLWHGAEPSDDDMAEIAADCRRLYAEARAWATGGQSAPRTSTTLGSLIRLYQTDPDSPYQEVKYNTRQTYDDWMRLLHRAGAHRSLAQLTGHDFRELYRQLKEPAAPGKRERLRRAHSAMAMLRILFSYGKVVGLPHCGRLKEILAEMRFKNAPPREPRMDYHYTCAFIRKAHELGHSEMALAQALQFELTLRQRDVIGEWVPDKGGGSHWANGLAWNHIDRNWILDKRTTKTGSRVVFDLKDYPLVFEEMERIAPEQRIGPVIINPNTSFPYRRIAYNGRWRKIARAAGIPDYVWNMDSRAGGITEGSDAGADIEHLRHHAAHSNVSTTARYNRRTLAKTKVVAKLRTTHRENKS